MAYMASVRTLVQTASGEADLLNKVALLDTQLGVVSPVEVYRAVLKVGSLSKYTSVQEFLKVCRDTLGKPLTQKHDRTFVRLGKILNMLTTPKINRSQR
jgi:hypothetical protein